jgi:hypothetical protein
VIDNEIEAKELQWKTEYGEVINRCAIGIENVNFSDPDDDWFEVRIWYEDFEERQTEAFEDIANKTGTFHFDIDCPTEATESIDCVITAYIESGEVEKEVDFDCYIDEGISSVNWNSMVSVTPYTTTQSFDTRSLSFAQHTVTCKASYYNLGSRTDTFSDSFIHRTTLGGGGAGAVSVKAKEKKLIEIVKASPFLTIIIFLMLIMMLFPTEEDKKKGYVYKKKEEYQ